jgi:hypothetical protein
VTKRSILPSLMARSMHFVNGIPSVSSTHLISVNGLAILAKFSARTPCRAEATVGDVTSDACTAERFQDHDYSKPPHNTPDDPRDAPDETACQAQSADMPCQHERRYEVTVYQIATHDWIRLFACVPCTATLRVRHHTLGPRGREGIARIHEVRP